jgi:hypothetical protein
LVQSGKTDAGFRRRIPRKPRETVTCIEAM